MKNKVRYFGGLMSMHLSVKDIITSHNTRLDQYKNPFYVMDASHTRNLEKKIKDVVKKRLQYDVKNKETNSDGSLSATVQVVSSVKVYKVRIHLKGGNHFKSKQNDSFLQSSDSSTSIPDEISNPRVSLASNEYFSEMNMSCTCGKLLFNTVCKHVIAVAIEFNQANILRSLHYLPGSAQRRSQHRLYNIMETVEESLFDLGYFTKTDNVYLPYIAMRRAGRPKNRHRIPGALEANQIKKMRLHKP